MIDATWAERSYIEQAYEVLRPDSVKEYCTVALVAMAAMYSPPMGIVGGVSYAGYKWLTTKKTATADDVGEIYRPPRIEKGLLSDYKDKINLLRTLGNGYFVGATVARTKIGQKPCPVYIKYIFQQEHVLRFEAYDLETDETIGFAVVNLYVDTNNYRSEHFPKGMPNVLKGYGFDASDVNKAELVNIRNLAPLKYKNIGVVLIKSILQHCAESCDYRMVLAAVRNTQSYYYKLGFRSVASNHQAMNAVFAQRAKSGEIYDCEYGSHWMYLPKDAATLWRKEIAENPSLTSL